MWINLPMSTQRLNMMRMFNVHKISFNENNNKVSKEGIQYESRPNKEE